MSDDAPEVSPFDRWMLPNVLLALAGIVVILGLVAAANPTLDIPVVSKTICSMKGYAWFDRPDAWYGVDRPGCYLVPARTP